MEDKENEEVLIQELQEVIENMHIADLRPCDCRVISCELIRLNYRKEDNK